MELIFRNEDLLTMKEAAKAIGVTVMTLSKWRRAGKIAAVQVGAYYAVARSEVKRKISERNQPSSGRIEEGE